MLGGVLPFDELLGDAAAPDERLGRERAARFGRCARRLWDGRCCEERDAT